MDDSNNCNFLESWHYLVAVRIQKGFYKKYNLITYVIHLAFIQVSIIVSTNINELTLGYVLVYPLCTHLPQLFKHSSSIFPSFIQKEGHDGSSIGNGRGI